MKLFLMFMTVLLISFTIQAQTPDYIVTAGNSELVNDTTFEFDIYILRVGSVPMELASFQTSIYFNDTVRNGGTLTGAYISGSSTLANSAQYPNPPNLTFTSGGGTIRQFRIAPKAPPGTGNGSIISEVAPGTRFGRFKIINTVPFNKTLTAGWRWNYAIGTGNYASYINAYINNTNTNITDSTKFLMQLADPIPVELTSFEALAAGRDVTLNWTTATEINSLSFVIERKVNTEGWQNIGTVRAAGTTTIQQNYSYTDRGLNMGSYSYRLKQIDIDGSYSYSDVVEAEIGVPSDYSISQNYPNPFNPSTKIDFQLPYESDVTIELYSIAGDRIATLMNGNQQAGYYTYSIDGSKYNLSSGVYLYRITAVSKADAKSFTQVKKMVMLK
jgi:hypothetical protein